MKITNLIESEQLEKLKAELTNNPSLINQPNDLGDFPINTACNIKFHAGAKVLLELGANPNSKGDFGRTPLYNSINNGGPESIELVNVLLAFGADPGITDESGYDLVTWAMLELGAGNGFDEVNALLAKINLDRKI